RDPARVARLARPDAPLLGLLVLREHEDVLHVLGGLIDREGFLIAGAAQGEHGARSQSHHERGDGDELRLAALLEVPIAPVEAAATPRDAAGEAAAEAGGPVIGRRPLRREHLLARTFAEVGPRRGGCRGAGFKVRSIRLEHESSVERPRCLARASSPQGQPSSTRYAKRGPLPLTSRRETLPSPRRARKLDFFQGW